MNTDELCKALKITPAMIEQIRSYINEAERVGWYYGREDFFRQRHNKIKTVFGIEEQTNVKN